MYILGGRVGLQGVKPQVGSETVGTRWKSGSIGKPGRRRAARLHDRVERRGPAAGGPTQVSQRYERTNKEKDQRRTDERMNEQRNEQRRRRGLAIGSTTARDFRKAWTQTQPRPVTRPLGRSIDSE